MRAPATHDRLRLSRWSAVAALLVTALLTACAAGDEPSSTEPGTSPPGSSPPGTSSPGTGPPDASPTDEGPPAADEPPAPVADDVPPLPAEVDPSVSAVVDAAVADLAARLDVAADSVEVLAAQPVTWPDSALGCPQEGMAYAQVLTDGAAVELSVDGTRYRYHAGDDGGEPFPCEEPTAPVDMG